MAVHILQQGTCVLIITVSTHFGKEVPYSKNWVFYSELLWKTRWDQILEMGPELRFIESEYPCIVARTFPGAR